MFAGGNGQINVWKSDTGMCVYICMIYSIGENDYRYVIFYVYIYYYDIMYRDFGKNC